MDKKLKIVIGEVEFTFGKDQVKEFAKFLNSFLAHPHQHTAVLHFQPKEYGNGQSN